MSADGETAHSPRPTFEKGVTLNRRGFLKATGATGAAAIGTGAASTTVAADDDSEPDPSETEFDHTSPTVGASLFGENRPALEESSVNLDPSRDEINLHDHSTTARHWWEGYVSVILDNRITHAANPAFISANAAIADAWEDGKSTGEARDDALDTIREFYDTPARNAIESKRYSLMQLAANANVAREDDDIHDRFVSWLIPDADYSGTGAVVAEETHIYLDDGEHPASITLPSGEVFETTMPRFRQEWDDGDSIEITIDDDLLDHYDDTEEKYLGVETANAETADIRGTITVENVADTDLDSETVGFLYEIGDILHEIEKKADELAANYDTETVEILFDALDEGRITPADVRSVGGLVEHYSGSTDATESRFQMALLMTLGLERGDLSHVSSMTVDYKGYSERIVERDDSGAIDEIRHKDFDVKTIEGQVFGELMGDTTLQVGNSYVANPRLFIFDDGADEVYALTPEGNKEIAINTNGSLEGMVLSPDLSTLYTCGFRDDIESYDTGDGSENWTFDAGNSLFGVVYTSDDSIISPCFDEKVYSVGAEDGSLNWETDPLPGGIGSDIAATYFTDHCYVVTNTHLIALDVKDGSEVWTYALDSEGEVVGVTPDEETVIVGMNNNDVLAINVDDQSEKWTNSNHADHPDVIAVSNDGSLVATGSRSDEAMVRMFDTETGTEQWSSGVHPTGDGLRGLAFDVTDSVLYSTGFSEELYEHEVSNGSATLLFDDLAGRGQSFTTAPGHNFDGALRYTMGFDGPSGEEIPMPYGSFNLLEMTTKDGEEIDEDEEVEWDRPEDELIDGDEYVEHIVKTTEEHVKVIHNYGDDDDGDTEIEVGFSWPGWFDDSVVGSGIAGLAIIGALVLVVVSFVTDLLPWT